MKDSITPSPRIRPPRTSQLLLQFSERLTSSRVTIEEIVNAFGDRGLGVLIAIFALPNVIPSAIPLGNALFGIPIAVFATQLMLGLRHVALPRFVAQRSIDTQTFRTASRGFAKVIAWFETLLKPRLTILTSLVADRLVGALCIIFAVVSSLPIPFGHTVPALGLMLVGLGLIESDGLAILLGLIVGFLGVLVSGLLLFGLFHGATFLLQWL